MIFFILFTAASVTCVSLRVHYAAYCVLLSSLAMGIAVFASMYLYFRDQNKIMEDAVSQIKDYISGDRNARIECDDEGELYRLFHEVNSLVSILNAQAENEGRSKKFMKDTISNISHQLKTPLAALNIYNGIMQEEAKDTPTIHEFTELSEQELDRIETLVQNLLRIAKLDAGTIVIEKNVENVAEMMAYIERHFAYRAEQEKRHFLFLVMMPLPCPAIRTGCWKQSVIL